MGKGHWSLTGEVQSIDESRPEMGVSCLTCAHAWQDAEGSRSKET